ncbi:MAG: S8 family serine peptidase, partial [Ilumatobacteraceae bacterium]
MRRTYALFGGLAIGLAAIVPVSSAGAGSPTKNSTPAAAESSPSRVAESPSGSYIVLLKADPLVITLGQDQLTTTRGINAANAMRSTHDRVLSKAGVSTELKVHDYTSSLNGFSLFVDHSQAIKIARDPAVSMVLADDLRQVTADGDGVIDGNVVVGDVPTVNEFLGLTGPGGAYQSGITGEGVLVGIIDTGIWPEHPSFADDGTYPKAPKLNSRGGVKKCDFGNQQHNAADVTFKCNNKLVGARQIMDTYRAQVGAEPDEFDSARDDDGHGTHTASTAAGNAGVDAKIYGRYIDRVSGIAPRAQIIAYKALGNGGGFTSDLAAAIDQAVYDGVDVINYSIGGGAQLVSADTIAFLYAQQAGVFVAV